MQIKFGNGMIPLPRNFATVKNPQTGKIKIGKVGFSFTTLIFSFLPSIFRSDWYNLGCMIGTDLILWLAISVAMHQPLTQTVQIIDSCSSIIWGFLYNLMYFRHLSNRGYVPVDTHSRELLVKNRYIKP